MRNLIGALVVLLAACGADDGRPPEPDKVIVVVEHDKPCPKPDPMIDPCAQVNGHQFAVTDTVIEIDAQDSRCGPPYAPNGTVSQDQLPIFDNRLGPCPISYTQTIQRSPDGGTEPACNVYASCKLQFNGGTTIQTYDLTFDPRGGFTGTQEAISDGQLCPHVKLYTEHLP